MLSGLDLNKYKHHSQKEDWKYFKEEMGKQEALAVKEPSYKSTIKIW